MSSTARRARLVEALDARAMSVSDDQLEQFVTFLELLARWNRRINLTAFDLDAPNATAIDRLILEPVAAAALVEPDWRTAVDIGSGGGSPAIPLAICQPQLSMTLIEARQRKGAFLREAVRVLGIQGLVETVRFEDWVNPQRRSAFDLVTIRAVRLQPELVAGARELVSGRGALVVFGRITDKYGSEEITLPTGSVSVCRGRAPWIG